MKNSQIKANFRFGPEMDYFLVWSRPKLLKFELVAWLSPKFQQRLYLGIKWIKNNEIEANFRFGQEMDHFLVWFWPLKPTIISMTTLHIWTTAKTEADWKDQGFSSWNPDVKDCKYL